MSYRSKRVRTISLKEAEQIDKKNVAYFTLTDGSVLVKKEENQENETKNDNNTQKEGPFSKYRKKFRNFRTNNTEEENNTQENKTNKIEESNKKQNKYQNENYQETQENNNGKKFFRRRFHKEENTTNDSPEKGYSNKSQIYGNKNEKESNKEQNKNESQEKEYSYKNQIYENKEEESNKGRFGFRRRLQASQEKKEESESPNKEKEKGYSYRSKIYDTSENKILDPPEKEKGNSYKRKIYDTSENDIKNSENEKEKGYSFKGKIYDTSENINLNPPENTEKIESNFRKYKNFKKGSQEEKNANNNNKNDDNENQKEIYKRSQKYKRANNENANINSENQQLKNYDYSLLRSYNGNSKIRNYNSQLKNKNTNDNYQDDKNYRSEEIIAIPVKFCDDFKPNMHNNSYSQVLYVEPYFNPDIIITAIKFAPNNGFGNQSNISYSGVYNKNGNNIFNSQLTSSFNDFDNLEEYNGQGDFRNDPQYKNVDLKYSDISIEKGEILKSKNNKERRYQRRFENAQTNNNNENIEVTKSQNNQINNRLSRGEGYLRKYRKY